jgi:integrase
LLPRSARFRVGAITAEEIDRYRRAKVVERENVTARRAKLTPAERRKLPHGLSNRSINRTVQILAQVLDAAIEYGWAEGPNPARGTRRKLRAEPANRASMSPEQVRALLDAAGSHRVLLATAIMAGGLRASELTGLRWRDVDLAGGCLHVGQSKTEAGVRRVGLAPDLLDELKARKAGTRFSGSDDFVFGTSGRLGAMLLGDWAVTGSETVDRLPEDTATVESGDEKGPRLQALS